jgi:hypothetical protein
VGCGFWGFGSEEEKGCLRAKKLRIFYKRGFGPCHAQLGKSLPPLHFRTPYAQAGGLSFAEQTALLLTLATPFHCPRVPGRIGGVTTMFSYSQSRATAMNHGACTACTTGTELTCDIFLGTQPRGTEYLQSALACRLTALPLSPISIYQSLYKIHPGSSHADGSLPKEPLSTRDKLRS